MSQVIISADSACDISPELVKKYNIQLINWRIILEDKEYIDGVNISSEDMYKAWWERKALPKSSAAVPSDYIKHFTPLLEKGYDIVHVGLGSGLTSSYQNLCLAAKELGHIYPVDSQNLSGGLGQLVIRAGEMAQQGMTALEIQSTLQGMCHRVHCSFLLDTLEFMKAGGRCSSLALLSANLFNIKPCIEVDNQEGGRMHVGEKYRGRMERCLRLYVRDKLRDRDDIDLEHLFITHSGSPQSDIDGVKEEIASLQKFKNIYVTKASGVISVHCGPRTLGVLFMTRE